MKILHVKAMPGDVVNGRRVKYLAALREAGHDVATLSEPPATNRMDWSRYDVLHLHNAPDGLPLLWLRFLAQIHPQRRPGIVVDINDCMLRLGHELDPVRRSEVAICARLLQRVCDNVPSIVASPAWATTYNANVIRNYITRAQRLSAEPRPREHRIRASVYSGIVMPGAPPDHHRNPETWREAPDVVMHSVPADELVKALSGFTVGLIPFPCTPFTDGFEPHKLFEYLAAGCDVRIPSGHLTQCEETVAELEGRPATDMPVFEDQLPTIEAIYEDAIERRTTIDIPLL